MYKNPKTKLYETKRKICGHFVKFYAHSEKEVYAKIASYENERKRLRSFYEVSEGWYDYACAHLAEGSVRSYLPSLRRAQERFGEQIVNDITPLQIQKFLQDVSKQYAYKTVRNQKTVLTQIFNFVIIQYNLVVQNPCDRIKIADKSKQTTREALTLQERHEIEATKPEEFQLAFLILYTGCRLGEALALRYSDIVDNKVLIRRAVHFQGNKPVIGVTKTPAAIRAVPLLPPLKERLEQLPHSPTDYIIGGENPITQSALARRWEHWAREHNLAEAVPREPTQNNKHVVAWKATIDRHQIRHEYATMLYEAGVDVKTAMRYLGHTTISMTMDIYTHLSEQHMEKEQEKLIRYIENRA